MKRILTLTALLVSLSSCGLFDAFSPCNPGYSKPDFAALNADIANHKQIWLSKGIKNYAFTVWTAQEPSGSWSARVTVTNGIVTSAVESSQPATPGFTGSTLDADFAPLQPWSTTQCEAVQIQFDPTYGFIKNLSRQDQTKGLADGSVGSGITDFTVTP
jgi:Family of unknown function (DUF6174)